MLRSSGSRWRTRTNTRQGWIKPGESSPRALGTSGPVLPPFAGLPGLGTTVVQLPFYYWGAMPSRETHTALHTSTDTCGSHCSAHKYGTLHHTALHTSTDSVHHTALPTSTDTVLNTALYPQELRAVWIYRITRTSMARQPGQASFPRRKGTREVTVHSSA